ncbi:MAG: GEVED domain-containing protein [bacterium]
MGKLKKRIPTMVLALSALILFVVALSFATTEDQKEDYVQQQNAVRSTSPAGSLDPDVAAKLAMEAEIQAKIEAEQESGGEDPPPVKAAYSTKDNKIGISSIAGHPVLKRDPGSVLLTEDFELETFPPASWDTTNTDPGYGFFRGSWTGGGTYAAMVTWHASGYQQDEWLLSPSINVSAASSDLKLEFWMLKGYSWPHDFKVYVDDGSGMTEIWDSYDVAYPDFAWYAVAIDLSSYAGGSDIKLGFQYYGEDADLFGLDDINVNDDAPQVGRCCYGDPGAPDCADNLQTECDALSGTWTAGLNCTDPCPVAGANDDCNSVTPDALPATWVGNNEGATFDTYCQWFGDYPNVWHAFTITECMDITIDYCGTAAGWGNGWLNLVTDCDCPDGTLLSYSGYDFNCANGNPQIYFSGLEAGTYYYPVMLDPGNGAVGDYELYVYGVPCPPAPENDDCASAEEIGDVTDQPFSTTTATNDGAGYTTGPNLWYCYTATCTGDATVSLCGSSYDTKVAAYDGCSCDPLGTLLASNDDFCSMQSEITFSVTEGNQYLIEVGGYGSASGDGLLSISCEVTGPAEPGDNCSDPIKVEIPSLPWCDNGQTTCGRGNSYEDPSDAICMGYYTNGEDIFYEIVVTTAVTVNFHLDPKGTSYSGMGLFTSCPPTLTNCIDHVTSSSSSPKSMTCVSLDPGTYYLMIDTWSTPFCIPDFDLCIVDTTCESLGNDDCADATEIGEVVDLAFSTSSATNDGGGSCQYAPNIWYCYTATQTGNAVISLCGSGYDTRMAVYDGCTCGPLGTELGCNDDACGLQSEVTIPVVTGNSYLVEVGGYSSNTGDGILNISVEQPCDIVCSGTAEGEPCIGNDEEDVTNGGCNSDPPVFGSIACDETVCGQWNTYLYASSNYRDTDWYKFTLTQFSDVTITAVGEFPIVTGFLEQVVPGGGWDCTNFTGYISPYLTADECDTIVVQQLAMAPGDYAIFVGGQVYTGFGCAQGTFEYSISVECVPAVPTYCAGSGGCDEYIENVTFETINNTTGCDMYGNYTALSATVEAGNSYPITITVGGGYSSDTSNVYVDWNQDLDFDDPGEVASLNPGAGYGPYSGSVTVPGDALPGDTRMRVRLSWNTDPVPCGTQSYGEVEDYTVTVGGEPAITYLFEPDPVLVAQKFIIVPMSGFIYLSGDAVGGDVNDMTNISLEVGGCAVAIAATEIIPGGYGELTGDVMKLTFGIKEYIVCEEGGALIWNEIESFFDVNYDLSSVPGQMTGQVTMIGHTSGDLDLSGAVDVGDLTFMVAWLFTGGDAPLVPEVGDVDANGGTDVGDLTYLVGYLFTGGSAPTHK